MEAAQSWLSTTLVLLASVAVVLAVALVIMFETRLMLQLWRGLTSGRRRRRNDTGQRLREPRGADDAKPPSNGQGCRRSPGPEHRPCLATESWPDLDKRE